jgi:ribosomal-protein-alanine N-acetyltransferase
LYYFIAEKYNLSYTPNNCNQTNPHKIRIFHLIFETPRLAFRELTPDDDQHFFNLNNDPEVIKYTGDRPFANLIDARNFLDHYDAYSKYAMGRWAVILKATGEFTGWCGLKFQPDLSVTGEVDLGYRFFRKFWGKGIAGESAKACIQYGFKTLGLKRIIGRVMEGNIASVKVLEKCGMHFVKEMKFEEHPGLWYEIQNPNWNETSYSPINCNFYDELEAAATLKRKCVIVYKNEIGVNLKTEGIFKTFAAKNREEFAELEDGTIFRLDKLVSVDGKMMPGVAVG